MSDLDKEHCSVVCECVRQVGVISRFDIIIILGLNAAASADAAASDYPWRKPPQPPSSQGHITPEAKAGALQLFKISSAGWVGTTVPKTGVPGDVALLWDDARRSPILPAPTLPGGNAEVDAFKIWFDISHDQLARQFRSYRVNKAAGGEKIKLLIGKDEMKTALLTRIHRGGDTIIAAAWEDLHDSSLAGDVLTTTGDLQLDAGVQLFLRNYISALVDLLSTKWPSEVTAAKLPDVSASIEKGAFELLGTERERWVALPAVERAFAECENKWASRELFVFLILRIRKFFGVALGSGDRPVLVVPAVSAPDFEDERAGLLYYISGWALFKLLNACKTERAEAPNRAFWDLWITHNRYTTEEQAESAGLPLGVIKLRRRFTLTLPTARAFSFFW